MNDTSTGIALQLIFFFAFILLFAVPIILGMWKAFQKAGRKGWECIVPVYNNMVMAEIGGKPNWWGLLCLIPYANIVFYIWILNMVSIKFNKGSGFTVGLIFLPFIFWPILGFGDAQYEGYNPVHREIDLIGTNQD